MDKIFCPRQKVFVMGNIFLSGTKLISSGTKNILSKQKAQALEVKTELEQCLLEATQKNKTELIQSIKNQLLKY